MSVLLALLLVASLAGPFVASAAAVPSGMVTIPDANVSEDVPVGSDAPINESRLEGNVMASEHAESLQVVATTPERAEDYLENGSVAGSSGSLTLVLKDDTHSQGRRVAIGAEAVRDAIGYTPRRVYGTHEDGTKWSRPVEYDAGMLVFEVPHFSSNSISFSGTVSATGSYTDGSTISYDVDSLDSVSNFSINVTGETATETDTESLSGKSGQISVAGTTEPVGPSGSGDPVITASATTGSVSEASDSQVDSYSFSNVPEAISMATLGVGQDTSADDSSETATIWVDVDGNRVASREITIASGNDYDTWDITGIDEPVSSSVTVGVSASGTDTSDSEVFLSTKYQQYLENAPPSSFTISSSSGQSESISGYSAGDDTNVTLDLPTGDHTVSTDATTGVWSMTANYTERVETVDPTVSVNGHETGVSGTLTDGDTAQLTTNDSWIESGSNSVTISVGDGSLSSDAPSPVVSMDYQHDAQDKQSVEFDGEKWSESYNVSKTFASDRSSATLTIPFEGNVVGIHSIEKQVNGGGWSSVPQDSYSLNGTTLTVDLGSVDGGDTVGVRTTGRRVNVIDGSITVLKPTVKGERLDTKFRVESWSSDAHISVGATPDSRRVHYLYKESWSNSDPYSTITSEGYNFVYLPGASTGLEARISTIPVSANPKSGEVRLSVDEPRTQEPQFSVRPGETDGDTVEFTHADAADSTHYVLKSKTNDVVRDDGTAASPLTLEDDDSAETLIFEKDPVSSDGGAVGPVDVGDSGDPLSSPSVVVIAWGLLTAGFYVLQRRVGGPSGVRVPVVGSVPFPGGLITAVGSVGSALLIVEFYSGRVSTALASVIESIGPIAGIAGVGIVVWWAYNQFRGRPVVIDE